METPVSTQWICRYLGISDIDDPSFGEVRNFMILWNLFESSLFQGSYSNKKALCERGSLQLDKRLVNNTITYFRSRYTSNTDTAPCYANLRLRNNDYEPLVKDVLLGKVNHESETVLAIIIIIYRYRCNLFHGNKAVASWTAQKDNFIHANQFLIACLEWKKNSNPHNNNH